MGIAIVVGNVIGSGIFAKPGKIAADGGDFTLIITAWIGGGLICMLGALCFAELAAMLPRAGGMYVYLKEAYGRPPAFLLGFTDFLFIRPASIGALSVVFVGSLSNVLGRQEQFNPFWQVALCLLLILFLGWVNIIGVIWGGRMQGATTLLKGGFLALVALLPVIMWLLGRESGTFSNYVTHVTPAEESLSARFAVVLLAVLWAYNGWDGVTPVAEEIRDPQRNMPLALFAGIVILITLYVSANFAYHAVLTMQEVSAAGDHAAEEMVKKLLGPMGSKLMSVGVMLSTFGAINSNTLLGPRVSFAMGRDDVFFRSLGRVHVNYRTPAIAILVQMLMASSLVIGSAILVQQAGYEEMTVFDLLTNYVIFSSSIFFMLTVIAVFVLRWQHPEWERPYRTWGYPIVPLVYVVFYVWFLWNVYQSEPKPANISIGIIVAALPIYYVWRAWAARHPQTAHDAQ
jgi:amino acid transporter